jgi:hypothetical protein
MAHCRAEQSPRIMIAFYRLTWRMRTAVCSLPTDGVPLITLRAVSMIDSRAVEPMKSAYGIVAIEPTATTPARVFVGNRDSGAIVELTRDGRLGRASEVTKTPITTTGLALDGHGRLFVLSQSAGVFVMDCGHSRAI